MTSSRAGLLLLCVLVGAGVVWVLQSEREAEDLLVQTVAKEVENSASIEGSHSLSSTAPASTQIESRTELEGADLSESGVAEEEEADWLRMLVVDDRGVPVADAVSFVEYVEIPTDENGQAEIYLPKEASWFWVTAKGYEVLAVPRPDDLREELKITLLEAVRVHVRWQVPPGTDVSLLRLKIDSDGEAFEPDAMGRGDIATKLRSALGLEVSNMGSGWSQQVVEYATLYSQDEELDIWGLMPGVSMEISLASQAGRPVASSGVVEYSVGEEREIFLELRAKLHTLSLHVVDEDGNPMEKARVEYDFNTSRIRGFYDYQLQTDESGMVVIEGLMERSLDFLVNPNGDYASRVFTDFPIPFDGKPVEVVVEKSRNVLVYFQDPEGVALRAAMWSERKQFASKRVGNPIPHHRILAAPSGAFEVSWKAGGFLGRETIPAGVKEHVITTPAMGSLQIHASKPTGTRTYLFQVLIESHRSNPGVLSPWLTFPDGQDEADLWVKKIQVGMHQLSVVRTNLVTQEMETVLDYGEIEVKSGEQIVVELKW
ncbi:MAG: hypothetical protein QM477_08445 [Planctomycetota bacterium]